ncbi:hypothetical protein M0812_02834 [Anaeramoeba flamelloides]|uniref:Uncharacterized protein n=1 Tax=Anaeramoeba flamelloides TaxID=1746091 RepID=A0AAV7YN00_9EUKA|nr:hypothetical protein M0812_02834 [Anaeramoeba flamelloides]
MFDKATKIIYVFLALIALLSTILVILAPTLPHEITSDAEDESGSSTNQFSNQERDQIEQQKMNLLLKETEITINADPHKSK